MGAGLGAWLGRFPWQHLPGDFTAALLSGNAQIIIGLKPKPEIRRRIEIARQSERRISRHASPACHYLGHPALRHPQSHRQRRHRHAERFQDVETDDLAWVNRRHPVYGNISHHKPHLTLIANNAGGDFGGMPKLVEAGAIRKVICSYPRATTRTAFDALYAAGRIELELVPQGTLAERIRAATAGIPAFFTPTGAGTELAEGKETRTIRGRPCVLEYALDADFALIEAWEADRWGNLTFRRAGRNFNQIMAGAAAVTIAGVHHRRALGAIDPDAVITPGIFVDRVVLLPETSAREAA